MNEDIREGIWLSLEEIKQLYDYFLNRAGYISREFDEPLFALMDRLKKYLSSPEEIK